MTRRIHLASLGKSILSCGALCALTACADGDFDLRDRFGNAADTTAAAQTATQPRPEPDDRGVITYETYQVAVAQDGDTLLSMATRIGVPIGALAQFNGLQADTRLRAGEIIALPTGVSGTLITEGTATSALDVADLAAGAIERAPADALRAPSVATEPLPSTGDPIRHRVEPGETAFSIARLYNVPVQSLAEWNGLGADMSVRAGQHLVIPVANAPLPVPVSEPGQGSATPTPPSSTQAAPADDQTPANQSPQVETPSVAPPAKPDIGQSARNSGAEFWMPVDGAIIRGYSKGKNEGVDIGAAAGSPVRAASAGTVVAVTPDDSGAPIIVVRHDGSLLTVYKELNNVQVEVGETVSKGQQLASVRDASPSFLHFQIRNGLDSVDPTNYLGL